MDALVIFIYVPVAGYGLTFSPSHEGVQTRVHAATILRGVSGNTIGEGESTISIGKAVGIYITLRALSVLYTVGVRYSECPLKEFPLYIE